MPFFYPKVVFFLEKLKVQPDEIFPSRYFTRNVEREWHSGDVRGKEPGSVRNVCLGKKNSAKYLYIVFGKPRSVFLRGDGLGLVWFGSA